MTKFSSRLNGKLLRIFRLTIVVQVWGDLCLTDKLEVINEDPELLLDKKIELVPKCRHKNNFILAKIK